MGNIIIAKDLDKVFKETAYKVVVNEYESLEKAKHLSLLENLLLQEIEPVLTFSPRCMCGLHSGGWKLGRFCTRCKGEVARSNNGNLRPNVWFKSKVPGVKFVSPGIYAYVDKKIVGNKNRNTEKDTDNENNPCDGNKFSVLKYISDATARKSSSMTNMDNQILDFLLNVKGFKRDFRYFSTNFISICKLIAEVKGGTTGRDLLKFLEGIDDKELYTSYIPILNGKLIYKTASNKVTPTYNAIKNMLLGYIDDKETDEEAFSQMAIVNYKSSCLFNTHVRTIISSKLGVGRKLGMSSKLDFSSRNVCIPSLIVKDIREVHMPYTTSIVMFRLHIANVLLKRMSVRRVHKKIRDAKIKFDQEVYDILIGFIKNSTLKLPDGTPYQGIIIGRNPGLLVGSILRSKLTHIKSDVNDDTMEVSTPLAKLPNWDYDGDQLYTTLPLSQYVYELAEPLEPYYSVNSPKIPGAVYGKIGLGPIAPINIANKILKERDKYEN